MKLTRPLFVLIGLIVLSTAVVTPWSRSRQCSRGLANHAPVANDDRFDRHGNGAIGPVLQNDSDPDGDPMTASLVTTPIHGSLSGLDGNSFFYNLTDMAFVGTDSFSYRACDNQGACSNITAVTINVANQPPVAGDDSYVAHGSTAIGPMLADDSDPDGDQIHYVQLNAPSHGTLSGLAQPDMQQYAPNFGYAGPDSFTYKTCDQFNLCSAPATVSISVDDNPPLAFGESFVARGVTTIGPMLVNDSDPDGDQLFYAQLTGASHGFVFGLTVPDIQSYHPDQGYVGTDSFTYKVCDQLGSCSAIVTVTLYVVGDGENDGPCSPCNSSVGGPINVTNGNMYLQQNDYSLPSTGPAIDIARTYNSNSHRTGLFGRGWSTAYDESVTVYDDNLMRLTQPDGRAVYFGRAVGSSGIFTPLVGDIHAQITLNGADLTLSMKNGSIRQFNSAGSLLSLTDRNGNKTTLNYAWGGTLTAVTDPFGRVLTITTNANGQVLSISDALGMIATYNYGLDATLLAVTYADNSGFQFSYDGAARLTSVTNAIGNVVESHNYDGQGRAITSEKQGGVEHYSLNYVSANQTDVTDALGRVTKYTFDTSKGRNVVTQIEGFCGCTSGGSQIQTWTYDNQLNVIAKTDPLGHLISFAFDVDGNPLTETDATGTLTNTYNQFGELLTVTDQLEGVTTNTYDAQGNLLTSTNALGKTVSLTYDARGLLRTVTDARGIVTSFVYDSVGNLITKTNGLGHATQFAYDGRARLTSITNALGHSTAFAYDAFGRPKQVTRADGTTTSYEYDLAGRRTARIDAKGNRSTYAYDGASRMLKMTDAANQTTSFGYDAMSNLTSVTDALLRTTNYEYDDFDRLVKTTYPPATVGAVRLFETVSYDAGGNVTQATDTAGRVSNYAYDNVNRLIRTTDSNNETTSIEYDALSRTTALVDAIAQRYRFNYDALGRLKHIRQGLTVMTFTYDAAGNLKSRTDYNGALTTYKYDALSRLKTVSYPDATTVSYAYDKLSRLQTATNENGTIDFDYDKLNRVTGVTDVFGQNVNYSYDASGNRTKLALNAATLSTYRYDAVNRLTKIIDATSLATTYNYDATDKLSSRRLPNGVLSSYQYDGLDRLTRLLDIKGVATLADRQYQYDTASQITQITEPTITRSYGYDAVDRLTSAHYKSPMQPDENYAYDAVSNRTLSHLSASYVYHAFNRLASTTGATLTYDQNGNLISRTNSNGTTQYRWDFENRLRQVVLPNGNTVNYKYDALGRRIQRAGVGATTKFVYDGLEVIKDLNSDGSTVDYLNGPGFDNKLRLIDSRLAAMGPLYFLQDHLGSTSALTNGAGVAVGQISYDAFGNSSGSLLTRFDYTGRERDPDTGLIYYRARWYDPQVGRFISEDPIGLGGGINQFAYVSNNPQNATDPTGLYEIDVHYYFTYFLARKTGCFKEWAAHDIANEDQRTDEDPNTMPGYGATEKQRMQNRVFHALHPGAAEGMGSPTLWRGAMNDANQHQGIGRYLHYLQDTFSHAGYTDDKRGHSPLNLRSGGPWGDHSNDKTAYDMEKARRMTEGTWRALLQYAEAKNCNCNPSWDDSWWGQINEFLNVGTAVPRASTIDARERTFDNPGLGDPAALVRKRRILGLPDRYTGEW